MKRTRNIFMCIAILSIATGCSQGKNSHNEDSNYELESFFGRNPYGDIFKQAGGICCKHTEK